MTTEACQSMIDVTLANDNTLGVSDRSVYDRLAQETYCNLWGIAVNEAIRRVDYPDYVASLDQTHYGIYMGGRTYPVTMAAVTPQEYATLGQTFNVAG